MPGKDKTTVDLIAAVELPIDRIPMSAARQRMVSAPSSDLTHYMAALGSLNMNNPYKISNELKSSGTDQAKDDRSSITYMLKNPDKANKLKLSEKEKKDPKARLRKTTLAAKYVTDSEISTGDWLRLKLSKECWDNDPSYRTIVRNLIALAVENDPEKMTIVNEFICQLEPYTMHTRQQSSKAGTTYGALRGLISGDNNTTFLEIYDDFTICNWARLLYMAEENPDNIRLSDAAKAHIRDNLLVLEGETYDGDIRNTRNALFRGAASFAGFATTETGIQNSENHLLMVNGSTYLKNQLTQPRVNAGSDLEIKLCLHLDNLYERGLTEFNSIPYAGFTIDALLNLHDFAFEPVKSRATRVLDKIFYDYATHATQDGQSFRPFSRLAKNGNKQDFRTNDHMRAFISSWIGLDPCYYLLDKQSTYCNYAFFGLTTSYCLPTVVHELATSPNKQYLAMTGQPHGNAEISYKGIYHTDEHDTAPPKQYLLSGGGLSNESSELGNTLLTTGLGMFKLGKQSAIDRAEMNKRRLTSEIVSRNPVLILNGEAGSKELSECFYLGSEQALDKDFGSGIDTKGKNNSGIYFDTLVGPYKVHVPEKYLDQGMKSTLNEGVAQSWTLYQVEPGLCVATFDAIVPTKKEGTDLRQVGIMMVLPNTLATQDLIDQIASENKDPNRVGRSIKYPQAGTSPMCGRTLTFNPYAALDRYAIGGCDDKNWSVKERVFYERALDDGDNAPGWSTHTAIQESPDSYPVCLLDPSYNSFECFNTRHISEADNTTELKG